MNFNTTEIMFSSVSTIGLDNGIYLKNKHCTCTQVLNEFCPPPFFFLNLYGSIFQHCECIIMDWFFFFFDLRELTQIYCFNFWPQCSRYKKIPHNLCMKMKVFFSIKYVWAKDSPTLQKINSKEKKRNAVNSEEFVLSCHNYYCL